MRRKVVNPDLQQERDNAKFDVEELTDFLVLPGLRSYYQRLVENVKKHPELKATPEFFEMTREEQMRWYWEHLKKQMEVDPKLYFHDNEGQLEVPEGMTPTISPLTLHFSMF